MGIGGYPYDIVKINPFNYAVSTTNSVVIIEYRHY